jgi:hypothetical protein
MAAFSCNVCGRGFDFGDCSCDSIPDKDSTMNTTAALPSIEDLAHAFVKELRAVLGDEDYVRVVALNAAELNPDVCASGDFCDSNMVMDAAFKTFGVDPLEYGYTEEDGMSQEVCDLWNRAWDRGKELMQLGK